MSQSTREATLRSRFVQAGWLAAEIARTGEAWRLERHPFLRRWWAGELGARELQAFAAEHHHAVMALEEAARRAAALSDGLLAEVLERYADDQADAAELSCEFAAAAGWGRSSWYFAEDPLEATLACARTWAAGSRSLAEHLVTIQASEAALALVAARQRDALIGHYGFDLSATRYFTRRAECSARDAALIEAGLSSLLPLASPGALVGHAEAVYRSYWDLLSGVHALSVGRRD